MTLAWAPVSPQSHAGLESFTNTWSKVVLLKKGAQAEVFQHVVWSGIILNSENTRNLMVIPKQSHLKMKVVVMVRAPEMRQF